MKTFHKKFPNKKKHKITKKRNYKKGGTSLRNLTPYVPTMQDKIEDFINGVEFNMIPGTNYQQPHRFGFQIQDLETIQPRYNFTLDDLKKIYSNATIRNDDLTTEIQGLMYRRNNIRRFIPYLTTIINDFNVTHQLPNHNILIPSTPSLRNPQTESSRNSSA